MRKCQHCILVAKECLVLNYVLNLFRSQWRALLHVHRNGEVGRGSPKVTDGHVELDLASGKRVEHVGERGDRGELGRGSIGSRDRHSVLEAVVFVGPFLALDRELGQQRDTSARRHLAVSTRRRRVDLGGPPSVGRDAITVHARHVERVQGAAFEDTRQHDQVRGLRGRGLGHESGGVGVAGVGENVDFGSDCPGVGQSLTAGRRKHEHVVVVQLRARLRQVRQCGIKGNLGHAGGVGQNGHGGSALTSSG
mmetsp:Transcript_107874/g.161365  ORF Transcript_107874/g.161365 Transcript_107874/m.161365 type:complete len:251 (-) Transcript_107874:928-1680(-)